MQDDPPNELVTEIHQTSGERYLRIKYAVITVGLFLPLLWSFALVRSVYPVVTWSVMMSGGDLEHGRNYYLLRGETISGETIDIRPMALTNALYNRTWGMVSAIVANESFKLKSIHPDNAALLNRVGGIDNLPAGARLPDLLQAWGRLYNDHQTASSPHRLRAIRIDMYRWDGGSYDHYDKFIESWRKEL